MEVLSLTVHAIVATPGRILDLMNKNLVKIGKCGILVLDEVCMKTINIQILVYSFDWPEAIQVRKYD